MEFQPSRSTPPARRRGRPLPHSPRPKGGLRLTALLHGASTGGAGVDGAAASDRQMSDLNGGACAVEVAARPLEPAMHVETCSKVTHHTVPPSSGMHYPTWPVFRVYKKPVPWGFLVHGLEHGAVV